MRFDNISISIPPGYARALDEESSRYGLNRSEFVRVLFDACLTVSAGMILDGKREPAIDSDTKLPDFFPEVLPHKKAEAKEWLHGYLRVVMKIMKEREELKKVSGGVDVDHVSLPAMNGIRRQDASV
jgi:hypothetical protein